MRARGYHARAGIRSLTTPLIFYNIGIGIATKWIAAIPGWGFIASAAINSIDDLMFTVADIATGQMEAGDAWLNFGKKALIGLVTAGLGEVSSIGTEALKLGNDFVGVLGKTAMNGVTAFATNAATSAINAVQFDSNGNLSYNGDAWWQGTLGTQALAGYAGGMAATFVTEGLNAMILGDEIKGIGANGKEVVTGYQNTAGWKIDVDSKVAWIKTATGTIGNAANAGIEYGMTGQTTLNLLDFSDIAKAMGWDWFRQEVDGPNGKERSGAWFSQGLLELRIGGDRPTFGIGTGGINFGIGRMVDTFKGLYAIGLNNQIKDVSSNMAGNASIGNKSFALRANMDYGNDTAKRTVDNILSGKDTLAMGSDVLIRGEGRTEYNAERGGRDISIRTGGDTLNDWLVSSTTLQFESYRDGFGIGKTFLNGETVSKEMNLEETQRAVLGSADMALRLAGQFGWDFINNNNELQANIYFKSLGEDTLNRYIETAYNYSDDYQDPALLNKLQEYYGRENIDPKVLWAEALRNEDYVHPISINQLDQFCQGMDIRLGYDLELLDKMTFPERLKTDRAQYEANKIAMPVIMDAIKKAQELMQEEYSTENITYRAVNEFLIKGFEGTIPGIIIETLQAEKHEDLIPVIERIAKWTIEKAINRGLTSLLDLPKGTPILKGAKAGIYIAQELIKMQDMIEFTDDLIEEHKSLLLFNRAYDELKVVGRARDQYEDRKQGLEYLQGLYRNGIVFDFYVFQQYQYFSGRYEERNGKMNANSEWGINSGEPFIREMGDFFQYLPNLYFNDSKLDEFIYISKPQPIDIIRNGESDIRRQISINPRAYRGISPRGIKEPVAYVEDCRRRYGSSSRILYNYRRY